MGHPSGSSSRAGDPVLPRRWIRHTAWRTVSDGGRASCTRGRIARVRARLSDPARSCQPAAHDDCFSVYRTLVDEHLDPIVVGDSTGGVLALATLLRARTAGLRQHAVCVLLSPTVDYGFRDPAIFEAKDVFLDPHFAIAGHTAYVNRNDPSLPDLGPVYQDLRQLAPIHVWVGERELLRSEVERLRRAAQDQGVAVQVRTWPRMWHGWYVMADRLLEGRRALQEAGALIRACVPPRSA